MNDYVKYEAFNLEDIAKMFMRFSEAEMLAANRALTNSKQVGLMNRSATWADAARILRNTTINPVVIAQSEKHLLDIANKA